MTGLKTSGNGASAEGVSEALEMLRSGQHRYIRLDWNIGSDEFFRLASACADAGAEVKQDTGAFVIVTEEA
ncbi:hypothetical protein CYR55_20710 [Chimaeribacter californicus]|jgi:hypothetical protein|uniref:Uncharacterized protein n=1 Tax=Chimaeribacter californicus TaxID=2060067 RepID=A0A2N5DWD3_9GAMM|nr:hypothetical protein [Chimaeribacter californicus]PLR31485.1 hypothetical protein CYR55_20710 [Chimaeribacter californicus]